MKNGNNRKRDCDHGNIKRKCQGFFLAHTIIYYSVISYCLDPFRTKRYLKVEDDGPYQAKDDGWSPICDVSGVNVNKFDLEKMPSR